VLKILKLEEEVQ